MAHENVPFKVVTSLLFVAVFVIGFSISNQLDVTVLVLFLPSAGYHFLPKSVLTSFGPTVHTGCSGANGLCRGLQLRLERISCVCGKHCKITACNVKIKSRYVANANVGLNTKKEATAMRVTIKSYYKFSNNEYRPMFIDTELDCCACQAGLIRSPLHNAVMNILENHTNINQQCPLPASEYYVKDLNFQASHLPSIIPIGRYLINGSTYVQNNDWGHNFPIYFSVTYYGVKDLAMG